MADWHIKITGIAPLIAHYHDSENTLDEVKDGVIAAVKAALEFQEGDDLALDEALANLKDSTDEDGFDQALNELYDWADKERVWIDPID